MHTKLHAALASSLLLPLLATPSAAAEAAPPEASGADSAAIVDRIEAWLAPWDEAGELWGTVLVAREDEVLVERSFGWADAELEVPNRPESRFLVASITKPMTVVIAARLLEAGRVALGDPVSRWLPELPRGDEMTVEHLLRHRSGIPHRVTDELEETVPRTAAEMVRLAAGEELLFDPGSDESYSSGGYAVLARVLELAGGKSYPELLQEHVFAPSGMTHSSHADHRRLLAGRTDSYLPGIDGPRNAPCKDYSFLVGAGSVYSTAGDLFAFARALAAGTLGGIARDNLVDEDGFSANGRTNGFRAFVDLDADTGIAVAYVTNYFNGAGDRLRAALPRIAAGEEVPLEAPPEVEPVRLHDETLRRWSGRYQLRPGTILDLAPTGEGTMDLSGWLLVPVSDTVLFSPQDYGEVTVVTGADGEVERLDWRTGEGDPLAMPRVGPLEAGEGDGR